MTIGYLQSMPLRISYNDEFWDSCKLIEVYPIRDSNWEYSPKYNKIMLKPSVSKNYDIDPWARLIRAWEHKDRDGEILTGGWCWLYEDKLEITFEVRFTTVAGKSVRLFRLE